MFNGTNHNNKICIMFHRYLSITKLKILLFYFYIISSNIFSNTYIFNFRIIIVTGVEFLPQTQIF